MVNTYLRGRKIVIEQSGQCPPVETLHLIRKLRWIGMEEEAKEVQLKIQKATRTGGVITVAHDTD